MIDGDATIRIPIEANPSALPVTPGPIDPDWSPR